MCCGVRRALGPGLLSFNLENSLQGGELHASVACLASPSFQMSRACAAMRCRPSRSTRRNFSTSWSRPIAPGRCRTMRKLRRSGSVVGDVSASTGIGGALLGGAGAAVPVAGTSDDCAVLAGGGPGAMTNTGCPPNHIKGCGMHGCAKAPAGGAPAHAVCGAVLCKDGNASRAVRSSVMASGRWCSASSISFSPQAQSTASAVGVCAVWSGGKRGV